VTKTVIGDINEKFLARRGLESSTLLKIEPFVPWTIGGAGKLGTARGGSGWPESMMLNVETRNGA